MFAVLAAESPRPFGALSPLLGSTGGKVALMAGGTTALALVLLVLMTVLGAVLG
jgi:hypothetical protein